MSITQLDWKKIYCGDSTGNFIMGAGRITLMEKGPKKGKEFRLFQVNIASRAILLGVKRMAMGS